jgi:hypothetical protein
MRHHTRLHALATPVQNDRVLQWLKAFEPFKAGAVASSKFKVAGGSHRYSIIQFRYYWPLRMAALRAAADRARAGP